MTTLQTLRVMLDARQWRAAAGRPRGAPAATPTLHSVAPATRCTVEDFLFTYYTLKPGQFKRWHPGAGVILLDFERLRRFYRPATEQELLKAVAPEVARTQAEAAFRRHRDVTDFVERRAITAFTHEILRNTMLLASSVASARVGDGVRRWRTISATTTWISGIGAWTGVVKPSAGVFHRIRAVL